MGDVCVQFAASLLDLIRKRAVDGISTLIALVAANHTFEIAPGTTNRQLPARHGNEQALAAFDHADITDDKAVIECDAAKSLELVFLGSRRTDSNFSNFQGASPSCLQPNWWSTNLQSQ